MYFICSPDDKFIDYSHSISLMEGYKGEMMKAEWV
jgi:hypothetical protein